MIAPYKCVRCGIRECWETDIYCVACANDMKEMLDRMARGELLKPEECQERVFKDRSGK